MKEERQELVRRLRGQLQKGSRAGLQKLLQAKHPADVAELLEDFGTERRVQLLGLLGVQQAAEVVEELEPQQRSLLLRELETSRVARILDEMANDDVADVLSDLGPTQTVDLLELMEEGEAADVQELLEYLEDTAGGIMTTEFVALEENLSAQEAVEALRQLAPDAETVYYVYVIDEASRLRGVMSLRELIVAGSQTPLTDIMQPNVITVQPEDDQEEVAQTVAKYDLLAVPVVAAAGELLGIITIDDILDVVEEEATEDIYRLSGTPPEEADLVRVTAWERARARFPWLLIVLGAELVAASVIEGFTYTLEAIVALAYFVPVLTGMGGNVGTQSLAVAVRGLGTGDLEGEDLWSVLWFELRVGLLLGLGAGVVGLTAALIWQRAVVIGLIVGTAMLLNMLAAALVGTLVPFVLDRYNIDPAIASGPFVTTFLDIVGLLNYFFIATVLLRTLGYHAF